MALRPELLAVELAAALGPEAVEQDPTALQNHAVDGRIPRMRCIPQDADQISVVLRICEKSGAAVIPWGGGTAMRLGNVPRRVDVVLNLERLNGLVEHDDANLTATMQAGMTVMSLQQILRRRSQFLAVDPPHPGRATIGGMVAANINGPRRTLYGGVRDLVIGMRVVLGTAVQIKAGGKVVKNVAGYDMCKLFVGSLGTLGVITEVTLKMSPQPETEATVVARGTLHQTVQLQEMLVNSPLLLAAIAILSDDVAAAAGLTAGPPAVAMWTEGFEEAVARHLTDVHVMASRMGLSVETLKGDAHRRLWDHVRDFGARDAGVVYRLIVPPASLAVVVAALDRLSKLEGPIRFIAHAGTGIVWVTLDDSSAGVRWFERLVALAQEYGGHAVMVAAPPAVKHGIDVWGPPPPALAIMRELKRQFDPHALLNPGRFVARL